MNKKQLIAFLLGLGFSQVQVDKLTKDTPDDGGVEIPKTELDAITTEYRGAQAELLKNDKEFVSEIQSNESKKVTNMWIAKIKQSTGLTEEEIKDKGYKDIIALAVEKVRKKGDSTTEELQQLNLKLENELKDLKENILPGKDVEVAEFKKNLIIENKIESMILGNKLAVSPAVAKAAVKAMMDGKVKVTVNEQGELELSQHGDGNLKVKKKDGSGFMGVSDYITDVLTTEKLLEVSGGQGGGGGKTPAITTTSTTEDQAKLYEKFPHLKSSIEHGQTVKANIEANAKKD